MVLKKKNVKKTKKTKFRQTTPVGWSGLKTKFEQWGSWLSPGLLAFAILTAWCAQEQLFARHLTAGLMFWIVTLVLAGLAFLKKPDQVTSEIDNQPKLEAVILGGIVIIAAVVRLWRLSEIPNGFHFDEATNALVGLQMITDPHYVPIFGPPDAPAPTLYHYFNMVALKIFGISALGAKMVPALAGVATVPIFYFLVRRMVSRPVALAATLTFALMRWHINFSRINFIGILTPLFGAAAAYFLLRGMETKNRWHMALSGLSVALGLYSYYASNLIPFVLGPYMVLQLAWDRKFLKEQWRGLLLFLIVSFTVFIPLGHFALTEKHRFFARNGQVLIFNHVPPEQAAEAFWRNVKTTLLMFNYFGDCNGRHNIPEEPMISPLAGLFFGLGLIWTLTKLHRRHAFLVLWWFMVSLVPGFLTIEAPQGYRCIGAIIPTALLIAFGFERFWQSIRELTLGTRARKWIWIALLVVVTMIGVRNLTDYFDRQAKTMACWSEFSAAEAAMGNRMHAQGDDFHTYISAGAFNFPTIRFLAYPHNDSEPFQMFSSVPANYQGTKNISYMLLPIHDGALELLRHYYPNGKETIQNTPYAFDLFTSYEVSAREVKATRGLQGTYQDRNGKRVTATEGQEHFQFIGKKHQLVAPIFANWKGSIRVPQSGIYYFKLSKAGNIQIRLDQRPVFSEGINLGQGMHRIDIRARINTAEQPVNLLWRKGKTGPWNSVPGYALSPRSEVHGLRGQYYRNTDWKGEPIFQRIDPLISLLGDDFSVAAPFSIRWDGYIHIPETGHYTFGTLSNEFSWVSIDRTTVVKNDIVDHYAEGTLKLTRGKHKIRIDYQKRTGAYPRIILYWVKPGSAKEKIPFEMLSPR
ncbi:glycosyltransferase family 39 protein [bacterium]|nr:glycosyltransferase family 39 protein [bacterium]